MRERHVEFEIPTEANFDDYMQKYVVDPETFTPGVQIETKEQPGTFLGFKRHNSRGVGTRNFIVVMGTTSRSGPFAQALADSFHHVQEQFPNVDGVCAIVHTEGGGIEPPNNLDFVLRALAGFMVHPNVGAVLALDYGTEAFTNDDVQAYLSEHDYPLDRVKHAFMRISGSLDEELKRAAELIESWLPQVNETARSEQPLSALNISLKCGGSEAFSGISGNALAGWVAKEAIRNGGAANLAETDELTAPNHTYSATCASGDGRDLLEQDRDLQGTCRQSRRFGRRQSFRRQQLSRSVQHCVEIYRRGAQTARKCASTTSSTTPHP